MTGAGKPFRIKRQNNDGETLHAPTYNLCRCCSKPIEDPGHAYCSLEHAAAHKRLHGAAA
jgi:hypothetical protein